MKATAKRVAAATVSEAQYMDPAADSSSSGVKANRCAHGPSAEKVISDIPGIEETRRKYERHK